MPSNRQGGFYTDRPLDYVGGGAGTGDYISVSMGMQSNP